MNTTPKLCHHRGAQQGYVTISGTERYLGAWPRDQKKPPAAVREAYDALIARWLANGRKLPEDAAPSPAAVVTVNTLILAFVKYAEGHYHALPSGKSAETEGIKSMCKVLTDLFGRLPVAEFGPKALKAVRAKMVELDWSRSYCNKQVNRLKRMVKWGVAEELVPPSVLHGLQAVGAIRKGEPNVRETAPVKPVPDAHVEAALPFMSRQVATLVRLQVLTGARPGEMVLARTGDIDRTGRVWVYVPERHKNQHRGHAREIYLGPKAQEVITPWLRDDPEAYLFSPAEAEEERHQQQRAARKSKVQPSQQNRRKRGKRKEPGSCYTTQSYGRAITYACKKADAHARKEAVAKLLAENPKADPSSLDSVVFVPNWSPHRLRHNAATNMRKEFGVEMAQLALGHASMTATQIYAERDREKVMGVFERVG